MKKVLIIDNYDSFTYNLLHAVEEILNQDVEVFRNDKIELATIDNYDYLILSPGPGLPEEAGNLLPIIENFGTKKKILGVCLGMQAIAQVYGAKLNNLKKVFHGMQTEIIQTDIGSNIFKNLPKKFMAGRYHSWVVSPKNLPETLLATAYDKEGTLMGLQHKKHKIFGVQFHPESILTPVGNQIIENFLKL